MNCNITFLFEPLKATQPDTSNTIDNSIGIYNNGIKVLICKKIRNGDIMTCAIIAIHMLRRECTQE